MLFNQITSLWMSQYSFILSIETRFDSNWDVAFTAAFNIPETYKKYFVSHNVSYIMLISITIHTLNENEIDKPAKPEEMLSRAIMANIDADAITKLLRELSNVSDHLCDIRAKIIIGWNLGEFKK